MELSGGAKINRLFHERFPYEIVREKMVEVPRIEVQEVIKHVPKHIVETRETIVEIPCIQVQERIVEHPEVHINEVTKHVPKVVEVQEVVKNVTKVDWQGVNGSSTMSTSLDGALPSSPLAS